MSAATPTPATASDDQRYMAMALALGRRGLGQTWPNPAVGCVLVKDGHVVGQGWTQPGGRPHAEPEALQQAGDKARGGTAYVTLEPCAHYGKTPPCAEAIIKAGVARVVVGCLDPDPRVDGRGIDKLQAAGIAVETGVLAAHAKADLAGFLLKIQQGRPLFTWKVASSLDGRIALSNGASQWITGEAARRVGHGLRATHDAILVGRGTAEADDPSLTTRLPGAEHRSPVRLLVDSHGQTPLTSKLAQTATETPVWLVCLKDAPGADEWSKAGAKVLPVDTMEPINIAKLLGEQGLTRVLVEGGATVAGRFMAAGLVDRVEWFRSRQILGGDGLPALGPLALTQLSDAQQYQRESARPLGSDSWERYVAV